MAATMTANRTRNAVKALRDMDKAIAWKRVATIGDLRDAEQAYLSAERDWRRIMGPVLDNMSIEDGLALVGELNAKAYRRRGVRA